MNWRFLTLLFFVFTLASCQISQQTKRKVTQIIEVQKDNTLTCDDVIDRCALLSPYESVFNQAMIDGKDRVQLIDYGSDALAMRIHFIRAAKKNIDIQTFIWVNDDAGLLMIRELLAAARRGVKVRVIIDQMFSMGSPRFVAEISTLHENLSFRMYNPVFGEADTSPLDFVGALACCLASMNKRMHNKVFIVDGQYGMVGGRNFQNRYYDWDAVFNYKDRDVLGIGPEVSAMSESFESFWQSEHVVPTEYLLDVSQRILSGKVTHNDWEKPYDEKAVIKVQQATDIKSIKEKWISEVVAVNKLDFFSDTHDKPFNKKSRKKNIQLTESINDLIASTEHKLLMQTPYLVFSKKARKMLKKLRKEKPDYELIVSTNSLASTDAFYVYAISFKYKRYYLKKLGMNIHEFRKQPADWTDMFSFGQINEKTRFGMHSKSFVVDDRYSMIGSHNFDPRSDYLNTEAGFIIDSEIFAQKLTKNITQDILNKNSWRVAAKEQIPFFSDVSGFMATISRKLPVFDIWPFRYATSYELKENHEEVAPNHPDFYKNYEAVGNFPKVDLPLKEIQTIIISAFAGFAEPVM
ncbi:phospholipase D-like domain-containing protein [Marinicella rhabdoformis]|uniref:phospholipase D-like domain-containing protein n=1 Tax=Marinicella rhabdoformis TaxID=2580566 RepID=UPI0015D076EC|nr:phospholipase D family protein [Marinicella rhabdoformis]